MQDVTAYDVTRRHGASADYSHYSEKFVLPGKPGFFARCHVSRRRATPRPRATAWPRPGCSTAGTTRCGPRRSRRRRRSKRRPRGCWPTARKRCATCHRRRRPSPASTTRPRCWCSCGSSGALRGPRATRSATLRRRTAPSPTSAPRRAQCRPSGSTWACSRCSGLGTPRWPAP